MSLTKLFNSGFTLFVLYINDLVKSLPNDAVVTLSMCDGSIIIATLNKQAFQVPRNFNQA